MRSGFLYVMDTPPANWFILPAEPPRLTGFHTRRKWPKWQHLAAFIKDDFRRPIQSEMGREGPCVVFRYLRSNEIDKLRRGDFNL